jgi:hypothetical protein
VVIHQKPQFTFFLIAQVRTPPKLPLVSPLTLALVYESTDNIIRIARFDAWLRQILPVAQSMTDLSLLVTLTEMLIK